VSRLKQRFEQLAADARTALVPYIMTGDPQLEVTVPLMHAMVAAGADVIELGAPFSDPMADGPVIQLAAERALANKVDVQHVFATVREFRRQDNATPIIMMGYLNPIEVMGYAHFARQAADCGIDGIITVDMPPEEADDYVAAFAANGLDPVFLLAPTTTEQRIDKIAAVASGFVYYVSLKGVTGSASLDVNEVAAKVATIRQHISLPVGVGFGISDAEAAAKVSACADAVVVGSAIVKRMAANSGNTEKIIEQVTELLASMRSAMDANVTQDKKTA
jgi:tryptophan synthase alpha chain